MTNKYINSHQRFSQCIVCAYCDTNHTDEPCKTCRRTKNPLKPISRIYINNVLYVLAKGGEDE